MATAMFALRLRLKSGSNPVPILRALAKLWPNIVPKPRALVKILTQLVMDAKWLINGHWCWPMAHFNGFLDVAADKRVLCLFQRLRLLYPCSSIRTFPETIIDFICILSLQFLICISDT